MSDEIQVNMLGRDLYMPIWSSEKGSGLEMWVGESWTYREYIWNKKSPWKSESKCDREDIWRLSPENLQDRLIGKSRGFVK